MNPSFCVFEEKLIKCGNRNISPLFITVQEGEEGAFPLQEGEEGEGAFPLREGRGAHLPREQGEQGGQGVAPVHL